MFHIFEKLYQWFLNFAQTFEQLTWDNFYNGGSSAFIFGSSLGVSSIVEFQYFSFIFAFFVFIFIIIILLCFIYKLIMWFVRRITNL